jgi:hypothetical protein
MNCVSFFLSRGFLKEKSQYHFRYFFLTLERGY